MCLCQSFLHTHTHTRTRTHTLSLMPLSLLLVALAFHTCCSLTCPLPTKDREGWFPANHVRPATIDVTSASERSSFKRVAAQAQAILRHRYGRLTTHRLDQDVQNGMEMDSEDEAFRLIGTPNGPSTDPAPEPETDRMRCWPHCQTLQREIQGMRNAMMPSVYVDDIDNAHQAAVDACTSGSNVRTPERTGKTRGCNFASFECPRATAQRTPS